MPHRPAALIQRTTTSRSVSCEYAYLISQQETDIPFRHAILPSGGRAIKRRSAGGFFVVRATTDSCSDHHAFSLEPREATPKCPTRILSATARQRSLGCPTTRRAQRPTTGSRARGNQQAALARLAAKRLDYRRQENHCSCRTRCVELHARQYVRPQSTCAR